MPPEPTTLLKGTLDLLILKSLVTGEMHGLGVSRRIEQITRGTEKILRVAATQVSIAAFSAQDDGGSSSSGSLPPGPDGKGTGEGAFIITSAGLAGFIAGNFSLGD